MKYVRIGSVIIIAAAMMISSCKSQNISEYPAKTNCRNLSEPGIYKFVSEISDLLKHGAYDELHKKFDADNYALQLSIGIKKEQYILEGLGLDLRLIPADITDLDGRFVRLPHVKGIRLISIYYSNEEFCGIVKIEVLIDNNTDIQKNNPHKIIEGRLYLKKINGKILISPPLG